MYGVLCLINLPVYYDGYENFEITTEWAAQFLGYQRLVGKHGVSCGKEERIRCGKNQIIKEVRAYGKDVCPRYEEADDMI